MNTLLNGMKNATNFTYTENGALTHKSTMDALYDMFALGGAYRNRSEADCITLFTEAYAENPVYAMKCLFYLRDIEEGQGERRYFRLVCHWLANHNSEALRPNLPLIATYGRWDDLIYICYDTKLWPVCIQIIKDQLVLDIDCMKHKHGISLLGKWLPSENTSSPVTRKVGNAIRISLKMSHKNYRKMLSALRQYINVLERLMSANEWDKIDFDKIPSKAGLIYRNAFARHDLIREKYEKFIKSESTQVNAKTLYPYEVVKQAYDYIKDFWRRNKSLDDIERLAINKYWDNLRDVFNGASLDALAVVDTSGSMCWGTNTLPIHIAISLGLYCAEKARGPFHGHYISFSSRPQLIETKGVDFVDKVKRIYETNLCENTNIEATFDMILATAIHNNVKPEDMPKSIIVISDMEFDEARNMGYGWRAGVDRKTLMENIMAKWRGSKYQLPNLIFWNVNARNDNIPMETHDGITFVSGASPITFQMVMSGKTGYDLMMDKLNSERYSAIK